MASKICPTRFWIGLMCFFTVFTNYMARVNLSISIVAMVQPKSKNFIAECLKDDAFSNSSATAKPVLDMGPRYDWNEKVQGYVLGAYFIGYVIGCLPAGMLSERFGAKFVIFWTSLLTAILTSASVFAAYGHWTILYICRFIIGFIGGFVYPGVQYIIAHWAPPEEKGLFSATLMGNTIATVITWPLVGTLTQAVGWQWGFHALAVIILVFALIFKIVASDDPDNHHWIDEEEKNFIMESRKGTVSRQKGAAPYKRILTSGRFLVLVIAQFGNLWGLFIVMTGAPKFISQVLGFDLKNAGILSAIPYLARFISGFIFGSIGTYLLKNQKMTKTAIRKFFTLFSHIIPATLLFLMMLVGCDYKGAVAILVLNQGINGAAVITNLINPQDLAPNYAATLFGLMNAVAGCTGFIVPAITGALTEDNNGIKEWNINFAIAGAVYMASGIIFMCFGTGEVQSWNEKPEQ